MSIIRDYVISIRSNGTINEFIIILVFFYQAEMHVCRLKKSS